MPHSTFAQQLVTEADHMGNCAGTMCWALLSVLHASPCFMWTHYIKYPSVLERNWWTTRTNDIPHGRVRGGNLCVWSFSVSYLPETSVSVLEKVKEGSQKKGKSLQEASPGMLSLPQGKGFLLQASQELLLSKGQGLAPTAFLDHTLSYTPVPVKQQLSVLPYHRWKWWTNSHA